MGNWTIHELGRLLADASHEDRREDRTHNTANEIASWTGLVTPPGASGSVGVGYDAAGDLTTHGQIDDPDLKLYAYDADGSLSRISRLVADPQGGTILPIAEYVHDALGRRVWTTVWRLDYRNRKCCARSMLHPGQLDHPGDGSGSLCSLCTGS